MLKEPAPLQPTPFSSMPSDFVSLRGSIRLLAAGCLLALVTPAIAQTPRPPAPPAGGAPAAPAGPSSPDAPKDPKARNSYAIGMDLGAGLARQFKTMGVEVDPQVIAAAFLDSFRGSPTKLTEAEMRQILTALQAEVQQKAAAMRQQQAEGSKKEGDDFLAANKGKEGVKVTASGLQYKVLKEGTGPVPKSTDTVTVHYKGTLVNGTEFDSSYKRNEPASFPVTGVIAGWTEALQFMKTGSKYQLFIPSNLAYGEQGRPGAIPPSAVLIFEIELLGIKGGTAPAPAATPEKK